MSEECDLISIFLQEPTPTNLHHRGFDYNRLIEMDMVSDLGDKTHSVIIERPQGSIDVEKNLDEQLTSSHG